MSFSESSYPTLPLGRNFLMSRAPDALLAQLLTVTDAELMSVLTEEDAHLLSEMADRVVESLRAKYSV